MMKTSNRQCARARVMTIAALLAMCAAAFAQQPAVSEPPYIKPCKEDIVKFCKDVDTRDERIIGCLKEHRDEVSESCKVRLAQSRVKRKPVPGHAP